MDSFDFINIKAEKAQAMRNYERQKMLKKLEVWAALAFLAWSAYHYFPLAATTIAEFLRQNVAVFAQPLYLFIAVNILIVVITVLSLQKPAAQDLYDEYVSVTKVPRARDDAVSNAVEDQKTATEPTAFVEKIVRVDNVVNSVAEEKTAVVATVVSSRKAQGSSREYRRSRSERTDRRGNSLREVMRRSETLIKHAATAIQDFEEGGRRRSCDHQMMDDLSNEEFRKTIETFIAAKKKTLIIENTLDLKIDSVPLTLTTAAAATN